MSRRHLSWRAVGLGALCACAALSSSGCSHLMHRHKSSTGCREAPFRGDWTNRPPLIVPKGLSMPDTSEGIKVPELSEPERERARTEPCLSAPPSYGSEPARPKSALPPLPGPTPPAGPAAGPGPTAGTPPREAGSAPE